MVEKIVRNPERVIIEKEGKTKQQQKQELKINRIIYRNSKAKNFRNFLITSIKLTVVQKNKELEQVLTYILSKYDEYEGRR